MLLSFAQWIQLTGFFTALRGSAYVYPIVMSLHMVGIAFFGGMMLMTDMRLLGWAMRKRSIADVVDQFRVPKRWGLLLIVTCGILMAGSKAEEYYYNAFFRTKLILLAVVVVFELVFYRGVYANPAALDRAPELPGSAKLAAALSLAAVDRPSPVAGAASATSSRRSIRSTPRSHFVQDTARCAAQACSKDRTTKMLLLQTNAIADALNSSEWVFPIAECFHIAAFAWSIGLIAAGRLSPAGFRHAASKPLGNRRAPPRPGLCWAGRGVAFGPRAVPVGSAHVPAQSVVRLQDRTRW